jgi:predicted nuclease of predicted toxin-antitoxin system
LAEFGVLVDENIHPRVIEFLRMRGIDVVSVEDLGLAGLADVVILRRATGSGRLVLTHDSDFGRLAVAAGEPISGILYVRPGHIRPEFTIATLEALYDATLEITPPCIVVASRRGSGVWVRSRSLENST